jgi:polysaccharide deacetylase family protein (PEP-CTERM system associated)
MDIVSPAISTIPDSSKFFLITIDVEDWFQVENFKPWIPFETWKQRELRVVKNVHRLLDLFDSTSLSTPVPLAGDLSDQVDLQSTRTLSSPKATFFVLGWIADNLPFLVREIAARGHEVASHGCDHDLPSKMPERALRQDLLKSRERLEDITGSPVVGYRAPSFAIDDRILTAIAESGYSYDSSYNSFRIHGRYGKISLNGQKQFGIARRITENFCELPISNINLFGCVLPIGGGAYFRLIPFWLFRLGVKQVLKTDGAYMFYIHPWEVDPEQPRLTAAAWQHKLKHYTNIHETYARLQCLMTDFSMCRFITCCQYLGLHNGFR